MVRGSNVLGEQQSGTPAGTVEELRKAGLNPANIASCAPFSFGGVRGCPVYERCRFDATINGGFKDNAGPRNIGYYLQTHEGKAKEDECSCFFFTQNLQDRMDHGTAERMKGKVGEHIAIIAQEGETITKQYEVNVNYGTNLPVKWMVQEHAVLVKAFPRPGEDHKLTYEKKIARRQAERDAKNPMLQIGPPQRIEAGAGAAMEDFIQPELDEQAVASAEPVKEKGKR